MKFASCRVSAQQGQIDIGQFCVAMYDERMSGIRMAESLQVRGWLDTQVPRYDK
jgi:hypothetical protein